MKKTKRHYFFLLFVIIICQFSCHNGDPASPQKDVYVCGYTGVAPTINASYWKNGVISELSNPANAYSFARGILMVGNDLYIVGGLYNNNLSTTAVYWKNGVMTKLSNDVSNATGISSNGTDIFISGYNNNVGGYWKNGNFIGFANGDSVESIVVLGSDLYAVGMLFQGSGGNNTITPLYWKNGTSTNLPGSSEAIGLAVGSSGVYICGNINDEYWSNGSEISVPDAQSIYSIAVSGSDVYFAGISGGNPAYWKNGVISKLKGVGVSPGAIAISGMDVYILGNSSSAVYWKNGTSNQLSSPSASRANALFIN